MGHDKLRKFAENETFRCLLQPEASLVLDKSGNPADGLRLKDHPLLQTSRLYLNWDAVRGSIQSIFQRGHLTGITSELT